jgi:hypothetical protein
MFVEHKLIFFKSFNLPSWMLMSWNGLTLAHYVGQLAELTVTGLALEHYAT